MGWTLSIVKPIGELMDKAKGWCLDIEEFITRLRFIQLTLLRVMLQMLEYFLTILK